MLFIGAFFLALTGYCLTAAIASAVRRCWRHAVAMTVAVLFFGVVGVGFLALAMGEA